MSRLVARLLLAMLMFPLAIVCYVVLLVGFMVMYRTSPMVSREESAFTLAGLLTWAFLAIYWFLLWRHSVQWTGRRTRWTLLSFPFAGLAGVLVGAVIGAALQVNGRAEESFGYFIGSATAPLGWIFMTILFWRETPAERAARLRGSRKDALVCPTCGYNLTGLSESRCPECGSRFTLDELLAAQPNREAADIESM